MAYFLQEENSFRLVQILGLHNVNILALLTKKKESPTLLQSPHSRK